MSHVQLETLAKRYNRLDYDELMHDYYDRTQAKEGQPPLAMNWQLYQGMEAAGFCHIFAYRDPELQGLGLYTMMAHPHHDNYKTAQCAVLAVRPEMRSKGIGADIVGFAEKFYRDSGVKRLVHMHRMIYNVTPLFERLGFTPTDVSWVKELD